MAVTQTPRARRTEQAEAVAQSIALVLNRQTKRYFRMADNKMYEAEVVYHFEPAKALEVQQDTDDRGYPMFVPHRPKAEGPVVAAAAPAPRTEKVEAPLAPASVAAKPANAIELGDEDDEVAARLRALDAADNTDGAVSV